MANFLGNIAQRFSSFTSSPSSTEKSDSKSTPAPPTGSTETPTPSSSSIANDSTGTVVETPTQNAFYSADPSSPTPTFSKAPTATALFPATDPAIDGEDCLHDCDSCTVIYPKAWSIEEDDKIYGQIGGWDTHLIVATGKTDWVRDVSDEVGSVMEAVGKADVKPANGVGSSPFMKHVSRVSPSETKPTFHSSRRRVPCCQGCVARPRKRSRNTRSFLLPRLASE